MSDDDDPITQAINDANLESDESFDDSDLETTGSDNDETLAGDYDAAEELILGKFKSPDDLAAAYQELERQFHERNQQPEAEYEPTPLQPAPVFGGAPQTEEDLVAWAAQDPGNAALWVIENQHVVPAELVSAVWQNWWEQAPWEASMYQMNSMVAQQEQQISQLYEPLIEQHQNQVLQSAIDIIRSGVPDFDEYASQVADFVNTRDLRSFFPDNALDDPNALADGINAILGIIKWREYQDQAAQQAQYEEPQHRQQATTQTRSKVEPTPDDSYDEQIQQMILNA